jgi:hypothetical protein
MGGEDEAAHYVEEWGFDWLTTPGAIDWLTRIVGDMAPFRAQRQSVSLLSHSALPIVAAGRSHKWA